MLAHEVGLSTNFQSWMWCTKVRFLLYWAMLIMYSLHTVEHNTGVEVEHTVEDHAMTGVEM